MGEVIKANFGGKKKETPETDKVSHKEKAVTTSDDTESSESEKHDLAIDTQFVFQNMARVQMAKERAVEITDYIFDELKGYELDKKSVDLRRQGLKDMDLEGLCAHLVDSFQLDWKKHPSFYGAVILEHDARIKAVMNSLPEEE